MAMIENIKTLFSKPEREHSRARLNIGLKTTWRGSKRVVVWKTSPDGTSRRGTIADYDLETHNVQLCDATFLYPEIDFKKEMLLYLNYENYKSEFDVASEFDTNKLIDLIGE